MALPEGLDTATVVGRFLDSNGSPDEGWVTFRPNVPWLTEHGFDTTAFLGSVGITVPVNLDDGGNPTPDVVPLAVTLLATDNESLAPSGWQWRADMRTRTQNRTVYFRAPAGATVDLATTASTIPASPRNDVVLSVGGVRPGPDGDVPVDSIPGQPGPEGPQGVPGNTGPTGAAGAQGPAGNTGPAGAQGPQGVPGNPGSAGADGVLKSFGDTGEFFGTFGALAGSSGSWTVCPAAWRSVPVAAAAGDVLDWAAEVILGVGTATADAEFDLAAIDNTVPGAPVILRCLSSGTNTPLANGHGGFYCWQNNARRLPGTKWRAQAGDIVAGTVTLALLYRAAGSGLAVGHASLYPSRVTVTNLGTPRT